MSCWKDSRKQTELSCQGLETTELEHSWTCSSQGSRPFCELQGIHHHPPPLLANLHVSLLLPGVAGLVWLKRVAPPLDQSPPMEKKGNLPWDSTTLSKLLDLFMPQFTLLRSEHDGSICPGGAIMSTSCSSSWCLILLGFQFSSVQLLSHVQLFEIPCTAALQASLSITNCQSLLKFMSIESVMPSNHLIICHPLLLSPSNFPSIRVFLISQFFQSGGQSVGISASASVLPMNIQNWFS